MKNKKKFLVMGMLIGLMLTPSVVNASGVADCKASITLSQYQGVFQIFEGGSPVRPITPKRLDGVYVTVDINGLTKEKNVAGSLESGQLKVTAIADVHYQSKSGKMAYYLNGSYYDSISATYQ